MTDMPDAGEPISRGRPESGAAEHEARWNALFAAALFAAVVLVNGIVAISLIAILQAMGWWETGPAEAGRGAAPGLFVRPHGRAAHAG